MSTVAEVPTSGTVAGTGTTGTTGEVPTSDTPAQSGSQTLSPGPQLTDTGKAAALPGMSLRWAHDTSRCMARASTQKTAGDRIVMAACANDPRQAFYLTSSNTLSVGSNLCLGRASDSNEVQLTSCGDGTVSSVTNDSYRMTLQNLNGDQFSIRPQTGEATLGQPLVYVTITTTSNILAWNFVGVGNVGGTLLPLVTLNTCLSRNGTSTALATCDASKAEQRWRYDTGFLVNDAGGCLSCNGNTTACMIKACDASVARTENDANWTSRQSRLAMRGGSYGDSYLLGVENSTDAPFVKAAGKNNVWLFGPAL